MAQKSLYLVFFILFSSICNIVNAQNDEPDIHPTAAYLNKDGVEEDTPPTDLKDLITGIYRANPEFDENEWSPSFEWRFTLEGETAPYLIRYDEETTVQFTKVGTTTIVCFATFTNRSTGEVYRIDDTNEDKELTKFTVTVPQSSLTMPNAFSPNDDGYNDLYKPKNYNSLVEFHAIIFNRWGQKLYEWDNPASGWDGTYNGTPVKEGVYYCQVRARGTDGIRYSYKKDVNLLRGFKEREGGSSSSSGSDN